MAFIRNLGGLAAFALTLTAACGDNLKPPAEDAAPPPIDAPPTICGNGTVEGAEECDDGNQVEDAVCTATCRFTCGNGVVDEGFGELCDTGIASGPGACPSTCEDGMACTSDVLAGSGCQAQCLNSPITVPAAGDGCCPAGANATTDSDCPAVCGNMVVESGEVCDTGIVAGTGACPTALTCNDLMACTTDTLTGAGTCAATCGHTTITTPMNGDGCCPAGATSVTDNDCPPPMPACGNGVVDPGETCDRAILVGPGSCPTSCSDGMACTRDVLTNAGTCTATCSFPAITTMTAGDGCCLPGGNNNTDSDCAPVCRNGVVEMGEQCDDGNSNNTDACSNTCTLTTIVPTAFRMFDLDLRDPHVFVTVFGCNDVTDPNPFGFSVNGQIQTSIQTDGTDADMNLDLSIATVFRPLNQTAGATTPLEIHFPGCSTPVGTTTCRRTPPSAAMIPTTASNLASGICLAPMAGTTSTPAYSPGITSTTGPCYSAGPVTVTLSLAGTPVTLTDARIAATYSGNPAATTVNGLLMGFISEMVADNTMLTLPVLGTRTLSSLLPGGTGNCSPRDDRDMNGADRGWWFYLNFTAPRVTWVDN
jgi:cysteine-rich repeat protein